MKEFIVVGLAFAVLVSGPGLASAQDQGGAVIAPTGSETSQSETAPAETAAPETPQVAEGDPDEVICHRRRQTGSNFRERICMTRRQAEQAEDAAQRSLARMRGPQAAAAPE